MIYYLYYLRKKNVQKISDVLHCVRLMCCYKGLCFGKDERKPTTLFMYVNEKMYLFVIIVLTYVTQAVSFLCSIVSHFLVGYMVFLLIVEGCMYILVCWSLVNNCCIGNHATDTYFCTLLARSNV